MSDTGMARLAGQLAPNGEHCEVRAVRRAQPDARIRACSGRAATTVIPPLPPGPCCGRTRVTTPFRPGSKSRGQPGRVGRVPVTGTSPGSGTSTDYGTAAYDSATGAQLWAASYHGPGTGSDAADAIAVSPDGSQVFVTGESSNGTGSTTGFATVAYDASTGAQLWVARYDGPAAGLDDAVAVAVSPDGSRVFITGRSLGASGISGFTTLAYRAATGATVWTQRYSQGNRGATAAALVLSPEIHLYVTGASEPMCGRTTPQYDGPVGTGNSPEAMTVAPNGASVFVTGQTKTKAGQFIYSTQAYRAATGARIWAQTYAGPAGFGLPAAIVVNPAGSRVFVTGVTNSKTPDATDYGTVAYNAATGARIWVQIYSGPDGGHNEAGSAAINPAGSELFVTGGIDEGGSQQFGTVAYQP